MPLEAGLDELGVARFEAARVKLRLGEEALAEYQRVSASFQNLVQDRQMGDGGRYRFRRYSRLLAEISGGDIELSPLSGHTILQSLEDNPLNGGVARTYQALEQAVLQSRLLQSLIRHDIEVVRALDPELFSAPVVVGIHQVRIVARPSADGKPSPEGVHRDAERYTFQHLWSREGVEGGEFTVYDQEKRPVFRWLQLRPFDSVVFRGTTWHSATPVRCREGCGAGHRDIFLIDFDPLDHRACS